MQKSNAAKLVRKDSLAYNRSTSYRSRISGEYSLPLVLPDEERPLQGSLSFSSDLRAVFDILRSSWLNLLLLALPLTVLSGIYQWGATSTFCLSFISLIPLSLILGDVTEDLAGRFGDTMGGLLCATFGNVVELLLSISALKHNLFTVVSMSLMGSILSNLLLVLGCCFFFGGLKYSTQRFNAVGNRACSSLLFLSCLGIVMPTASVKLLDHTNEPPSSLAFHEIEEAWTLNLSRATAVVLLICYICYLVFQLKTHKSLFKAAEEEEQEVVLTLPCAIIMLACITILVGVASEYLTGNLESVCSTTGLSEKFIGMIVLPIAGNACEHITAIVVAMKNKMDLALGVAVGSSLQIAMFVIPFMVVVAWIWGKPFSLYFDPFSTLALTLSVTHASFITADGTSHWLMGVELIAVYTLIAVVFYVHV